MSRNLICTAAALLAVSTALAEDEAVIKLAGHHSGGCSADCCDAPSCEAPCTDACDAPSCEAPCDPGCDAPACDGACGSGSGHTCGFGKGSGRNGSTGGGACPGGRQCGCRSGSSCRGGWLCGQGANFRARNAWASAQLHSYLRCKFGYFIPSANCGKGAALYEKYGMVYSLDPSYADPRDAERYAAPGYGVHVNVPLPPNVRHSYNYSWGIPSSRLTPVRHGTVVGPPQPAPYQPKTH